MPSCHLRSACVPGLALRPDPVQVDGQPSSPCVSLAPGHDALFGQPIGGRPAAFAWAVRRAFHQPLLEEVGCLDPEDGSFGHRVPQDLKSPSGSSNNRRDIAGRSTSHGTNGKTEPPSPLAEVCRAHAGGERGAPQVVKPLTMQGGRTQQPGGNSSYLLHKPDDSRGMISRTSDKMVFTQLAAKA